MVILLVVITLNWFASLYLKYRKEQHNQQRKEQLEKPRKEQLEKPRKEQRTVDDANAITSGGAKGERGSLHLRHLCTVHTHEATQAATARAATRAAAQATTQAASQAAAQAAAQAASVAASAAVASSAAARAAARATAQAVTAQAATAQAATAQAVTARASATRELRCEVEIKGLFGFRWYTDQLTLTKGMSLMFRRKDYNKYTNHSTSIVKSPDEFGDNRPEGMRRFRVNVRANDKLMELAFQNSEDLTNFCTILGHGFNNQSTHEKSRGGM